MRFKCGIEFLVCLTLAITRQRQAQRAARLEGYQKNGRRPAAPFLGITSRARRHQELVGLIAVLGRSKRMAFLVLARHSGLARSGLHQMEPPNKLSPSGRVSGPPRSPRERPGSPTLPVRSANIAVSTREAMPVQVARRHQGPPTDSDGSAVRASSFSDTACVRSRRRFKLGGARMECFLVTTDSKAFMRSAPWAPTRRR